jgi:hypothetical protein
VRKPKAGFRSIGESRRQLSCMANGGPDAYLPLQSSVKAEDVLPRSPLVDVQDKSDAPVRKTANRRSAFRPSSFFGNKSKRSNDFLDRAIWLLLALGAGFGSAQGQFQGQSLQWLIAPTPV